MKLGDLIMMTEDYTPYVMKGDKGVIVEMDNEDDPTPQIDFNGQGNEQVNDDGLWYVNDDKFIRLNVVEGKSKAKEESHDQTQLEHDAEECATYIMMRLEQEMLSKDNIAIWIVDYFNKQE